MATADIAKAISFIRKAGDPVLSDLAFFAVGRIKTDDVLVSILRHQHQDGGWAKLDKRFQENLSTLSSTWMALRWFCWLDITEHIMLDQTYQFLNKSQRPDGSWDEPDVLLKFKPPAEMMPGKYENQLWLTSAVCCFLNVLGAEDTVNFKQALNFIRSGWDGTRFPGYWHTHWMCMPLFARLNSAQGIDYQITTGCKKQLIQAMGNDLIDAGDHCAVAYASWMTGDNANELLANSFERVLNNQLDDGGWMTGYDRKYRAGFTVEALFLMRKMGILTGQYVQ